MEAGAVLSVTLADLVFRARQFAIAVVGVALVLAMALLLSGLAAGFTVELQNTIGGVGADTWVLARASDGQVTAFAAFSQGAVGVLRHTPGVTAANGLLIVPSQNARIDGVQHTVVLMGVPPGGIGDPTVTSGTTLRHAGDAVVDVRSKAALGDRIAFGDHTFRVVGLTSGRTMMGGVPVVYLPLAAAQRLAVGGRPLVTAVVTHGVPRTVPAGLTAFSSQGAVDNTVRQLGSAVSSINNTKIIMWVIAAAIIGALVYVAALERGRDFAVLKALGSSSTLLFVSSALQAVIVAVLASALAIALSGLMTPVMSQPVDIPLGAYVTLPLIAAFIGLVASTAALRRTVGADPAAAFG
jgi:putative ABC transport system permease protein